MARNKIVGKNTRPKSNKATGRDYTKDSAYEKRPEHVKNRVSQNRARRLLTKKLGKAKLKGKDVDHKDGNPRNNSLSNLQVISKKVNRGKNKPGQKNGLPKKKTTVKRKKK